MVIITNIEKNKFYNSLLEKTHFDRDERIKFVGTVYERELLKKIREQAYGYIHGHEVGGTNPSLLEALASTKINLLLDVGFNKEVAGDAAFYWDKVVGKLAELIDYCDCLKEEKTNQMDILSKEIVLNRYSWEFVCEECEKVFVNPNKD